jgi:hypothetical protein
MALYAIAEAKQRSQKVSHRMGDQNLLFLGRDVSCWSRLHLQSLAPAPVSKWLDVRQAAGRKIIAESLSQHDEKLVVPTPLSVGKG